MQMRTLTEEEQGLLMQALIEKQMHEATVALDLGLANAVRPKLERLQQLVRENQLCVIIH